MKILLGDFN